MKKPTFRTHVRGFWSWLEGKSANTSYYLVLGAALALTGIGLLMILSASSVESVAAGKSPLGYFLRQASFAVMGLIAMFLLSRLPLEFFRKVAPLAMAAGVVLLIAVQAVGTSVMGNKNWISLFGGFSLQPSEFMKLILIVWAASTYARQGAALKRTAPALVPVVLIGVVAMGLVLLGRDLGTVIILAVILLAVMYFAGVRLKVIIGFALIGALTALAFTFLSGNRSSRIGSWLGGSCDMGQCMQSNNALQGLGTGGLIGVGIGQSRQKWSLIPEAHNDFIFAIIGEELGMLGALVVLGLFVVILVAGLRILVRQRDIFGRALVGGILVWIIFQAIVNVAMVVSLLPVIGVPLPFVSYGGSALLSNLAAIGVLLAVIRNTPTEKEPYLTKSDAAPLPVTVSEKMPS